MVIVWRRRDRVARRGIASRDDHRGANLRRRRLVDMDLRHKDLSGADLEWADLTEADLRGTRLRSANLHGAYLTGARLDGADLTDARLDDTFLIATEFGNANLTGVSLDRAIWDDATAWPPGFKPPRSKAARWHGAP